MVMREQCVPGSLSSSPAHDPGNDATTYVVTVQVLYVSCVMGQRIALGL